MGDEPVIIGRAAPVLMSDDGTLVQAGPTVDPDTEVPFTALAPTPAVLLETVLLENRVLTPGQRITLVVAVVLALASGVVAVALAVSLAA